MKHLIYPFFFLMLFCGHAIAQNFPPTCPDPLPPGGESCEVACVYCNFDGYEGINNGTPSGGNTVCGQISIHNDQWFGFVAGSTSITFELSTSNCQSGNGLQIAIFNNCDDLDALVCNPGCAGCGGSTMTLSYDQFVVGQTYFFMIDGWAGDVCDYRIDITYGNINAPEPQKPAVPNGPTSVCPGGVAIYNVPPAYGAGYYYWSAPPGATINGGSNIAVLDAENGYEVTISFGNSGGNVCVAAGNSCHSPTSYSCLSVVNTPIPPTILPDITICNEYLPYTWDLPPYQVLTDPGTYVLSTTLTSILGCDSVVRQTVRALPPIVTQLGVRYLCAGSCMSIGGELYCESGNYSAVLESVMGCDSLVLFQLNVLHPHADITGFDRFYCEMDSIILQSGNTSGDKTWTDTSGQILATGNSLVVFQPGAYILESSLADGPLTCTARDTLSISGDSLSILVQIQSDPNNCGVDSVSLLVDVNVMSPIYAWSGPNGFSSTIQNPVIYEAGEYVLSVSTLEGCAGADTLHITTIGMLPDVIASGGTLTCLQPEVLLQGSSSFPDALYQWSGPNGFQSSEPDTTTNYPGLYTLTVTLPNGCSASGDVAVISETMPPGLTAFDGSITCADSTFQLQASSTIPGTTFKWSGPDGFESEEAAPEVHVIGEYTLTGTAPNGCTSQISVQVWEDTQAPVIAVMSDTINCRHILGTIQVSSSSNITAYHWVGPDGLENDLPVQTVGVPGTYYVTVTAANGCTQSGQAALLSDFDLPYCAATGDTLTCMDPLGFLDGTSSGSIDNYYWITPVNQQFFQEDLTTNVPGLYQFVVVGTNGCTNSVLVDLPSSILYPVVEVQGGPIYCSSPATLECITDAGNPSFLWNGPNGFTSVDANPEIYEEGYYSVTVTNSDNGCSTADEIFISNVNLNVNWSLDSIFPPTSGQNNGAIYIHVLNDTGDHSYAWYADSMLVATTQDLENVPAGDYTVVITDSLGCTATWTFTLLPPFSTWQTYNPAWKIQPNPSNGRFSIRRNGASLEPARIQILDAFGRLVLEQNVASTEKESFVDLHDAPPGWYFLNIDTDQGRSTRKILVLR